MAAPDIVMYEEEFNQIKGIISKLRTDANAKVVFLVDKNGQQIAAHGDIENLDTTSLASLTAGNVAATDGLARLIGEKEFSILFHEGEKDNVNIMAKVEREKAQAGAAFESPFAEITDEDIDSLFSE